jgi:hypothetical protein
MDQNINDLISTFRGLQQRLLQEIVNSHTETEMTLKQLVAYLNISAQNLTEVHNIVNQFNTTVESLKVYIENQNDKIDNMDNKISSIPIETYKIKETVSEGFNSQNQTIVKYLLQTNEYLKKLYQIVNQQGVRTQNLEKDLENVIKTIETDLDKNDKNLTSIITTLIENKTKIDTKTLDVKSQANEGTIKKTEIKLKFYAKIISILFASGGVIYTIIDLIIKNNK